MNFTEIKTKITALLDRSDYDEKSGQFINSAMRKAEVAYDWTGMEYITTGTLSTDEITIPSRYKNVKWLKLNNGTKDFFPMKKSYGFVIDNYPYGSTKKSAPKVFASKRGAGIFVLRPYPDTSVTYTYELTINRYSDELSDSSPTNYWTDGDWQLLFYGALIEYELDSGKRLILGTEDQPISPGLLYSQLYTDLVRAEINEYKTSLPIQVQPTWIK